MTQTAINYAKVLYELQIEMKEVEEAQVAFHDVPELKKVLKSPVVSIQKKHDIVGHIFSGKMKNFIQLLCDYHRVESIEEIFQAYKEYYNEKNNILSATLMYVDAPSEQQLNQFERFLCEKYSGSRVEWNLVKDEGLLGGFILKVKDYEYDWSLRGRMNQLRNRIIWR